MFVFVCVSLFVYSILQSEFEAHTCAQAGVGSYFIIFGMHLMTLIRPKCECMSIASFE